MSCLNCSKGNPAEDELKAELIHQTHPRAEAHCTRSDQVSKLILVGYRLILSFP